MEEYKFTDCVIDEFINTTGEDGKNKPLFVGRLYENEKGNVEIKHEYGVCMILRMFYMLSYVHISKIETDEEGVQTFSFKRLKEVVVNDDNRENVCMQIARMYKKLIEMGIVVGSCTFVDVGDKLMMQTPQNMVMYVLAGKTSNADSIKASAEYYKGDYIRSSIPLGIDYDELINLIG